ncbi:MAG: 2-oxoglutarate dehydrogenase E1 component [Mitsuaria chitosanitabida]|uniref:2-oxoglutarate dehydrogenase E1 component n=1 Tax=Roseateles chitosanitabidus TaxID=65048 RepID=UPI001B09143C|nr:2-oxoglutarate dehydrogenase E1 component [Roseateles chitosanitabidus]MBO9687184.1 2-oxoglutarate dehydrogenase E1 component [Roseateles chitosanitabidus]
MNDRIHEGAPPGGPATRWRPEVIAFIDAHRRDGHRCARLDPLGLSRPADLALLDPHRFGLQPGDWLSPTGTPLWSARTVGDLDRTLKAVYCGGLALDASAVRDDARREWLFREMEAAPPTPGGAAQRLALLELLVRAQAWEAHVAQAFPHAKRFSLEGNETLIPLLHALCEQAADAGVRRIFLGMPHRGRVNVLVNLMGMAPARVLDYFDPKSPTPELHTDLVYHLGGERELPTAHGPVSLTLAHNPSHLQSVQPVLTGLARACQDALDRAPGAAPHTGRREVLALMLHGDAAFAGQGVVMETLMLGGKPGYSVGGTVHVVINNQVGFTEPNPMSAWPAQYCTDVTRMVDAPVLRVNADEPEQALRAAALAIAWRARFGSDVVIDLIGYRRLGHSESDVPALTRPRIHAATQAHPTVVDRYAAALKADGVAAPEGDMASHVTGARVRAHQAFADPVRPIEDEAPQALRRPGEVPPLDADGVRALIDPMTRLPEDFEPHAMVRTLTEHWRRMAGIAEPSLPLDWCFAENLAYATILRGGMNVRISGMDVRRGTFLHRQAVWTSQAPSSSCSSSSSSSSSTSSSSSSSSATARPSDGAAAAPREFVPLRHIPAGGGRFDIYNSPLSEEAVLGFEYGFSVGATRTLTVWEAQFGDFVNGAQVFVDQYISSGEEKWGDASGLTVLLPHGNEGIGPDHSSGYLSRFLQLCGEDNLRVCCPSTSAQWFHLLRRQAFDTLRKPLIVMSPKGTLYFEKASHGAVEDLTRGHFRTVIDDPGVERPRQIERLLLCSGKVFYDLERGRRSVARADLALARIEQFYPFPEDELIALFARYPALVEITWVQEEHRQQGAWTFIREQLDEILPAHCKLRCVARRPNASGATSSHAIHQLEQVDLVARALGEA